MRTDREAQSLHLFSVGTARKQRAHERDGKLAAEFGKNWRTPAAPQHHALSQRSLTYPYGYNPKLLDPFQYYLFPSRMHFSSLPRVLYLLPISCSLLRSPGTPGLLTHFTKSKENNCVNIEARGTYIYHHSIERVHWCRFQCI